MPLLNYTTKVDVYTTLGAIQGQLVKHGARKIMQDYDDAGHIVALSFLVDTPAGPRGIRLPANVDAVHAVLTRQKVKCDREQAERVAAHRKGLDRGADGHSGIRDGADGRNLSSVHGQRSRKDAV